MQHEHEGIIAVARQTTCQARQTFGILLGVCAAQHTRGNCVGNFPQYSLNILKILHATFFKAKICNKHTLVLNVVCTLMSNFPSSFVHILPESVLRFQPRYYYIPQCKNF